MKSLALVLSTLIFVYWSPSAAQQDRKVPRIGFLATGSASEPRNVLSRDAFHEGLGELGYIVGKTINLEYRYGEGQAERLPQLVEELVRLRVDLIVGTDSTSAQVAKKTSGVIPVVFTTGANPISTGLVTSLARPGGNATGVTTNSPELVAKRLEILKDVVPKVVRFAFLLPAASTTIKAMFDEAQGSAKALGVRFQAIAVSNQKPDFEAAFRLMVKERIGGLITEGPPAISFHRKKIIGLAAQHRIPTIYSEQEWTNAGGLMSYGANRTEPSRRVAVYVDKILKGAKAADLPVEQPTRFELVINLKTAKQIEATIPQKVLARADRVIK